MNKKFFIENKGQFDGQDNLENSSIKFRTEISGAQIYFTPKGLTYRFNKLSKEVQNKKDNKRKNKTDKKQREKKVEKEEFGKVESYFVGVKWLNANENVELVAEGLTEGYFNYAKKEDPLSRSFYNAHGYNKLLYKNLYPGIDLVYEFEDSSTANGIIRGIKYSLILHPGSDPGKIQLQYSGTEEISIKNNIIYVNTKLGKITEHAPVSFYQYEKSIVPSYFTLTNNVIGFSVSNYDKTKTLIIDPWVTFPNLLDNNRAFEIDKDSLGNVYIYGGSLKSRLQKYSPTGTFLWSLSSNCVCGGYFGDMAVSPSGLSYIVDVGEIIKVNSAGSIVWSGLAGVENWRCTFNCDYSKLIIAQCGGTADIFTIDVATNTVGPATITFQYNGEIRALNKGFNGRFLWYDDRWIRSPTSNY